MAGGKTMNAAIAVVPSVTELVRSMEKSVQDAAIALQRLHDPGMSGVNRLILQICPDLAEEIRMWIPEKPWHFRLEMSVRVHTRTPGRFLRLLLRIKNLRQENRPARSLPPMLYTGEPPFFSRFFSDILWHDLFIAVQIEQAETGQRQICRILSFNDSEYHI
jgi:hypothetical protein